MHPRPRAFHLVTAALVTVASTGLVPATPEGPAFPSPQAPAGAPGVAQTAGVTASRVAVDLVVRDKKGRLIRDLEASDLEVLRHYPGQRWDGRGCPRQLVNFFNPSHIFIGGGIANFGNHLLVAIRRAVLHRSLPLATTHLSIKFSNMGSDAGVTGAVGLALDFCL